MNPAVLTQFLIDVTRGGKKAAFQSDRETVLQGSALNDAMRTAVRSQDIGSLWRAGAHPMALLYFARGCGWSGERYYACITDAQNNSAKAADTPRQA